MAEVVLNTIFQFKRGYQEAWERVNPILRQGEPGYVLDTGKLKIGNGSSAWLDLPYFNGEFSISADGKSIALDSEGLSLYGFNTAEIGAIPRKAEDGSLEWYKPAAVEDLETLKKLFESNLSDLSAITEKIKYEISHSPIGTLVNQRDKEIRVMCPANTAWTSQNSGTGADSDKYYIGFKAYAPSNEIMSFKEDLSEIIADQTMYYFENNDFAGIDEHGRKYSIVWLPVAVNKDGNWTYYGANSSVQKYIGWFYSVEWYDKDGKLVDADTIKINLSNEECHNNILPYYLSEYQKVTDLISISRLVNDDNTILVFNGGSAEISE